MCSTVPPCESFCEEDRPAPAPLGGSCHLDYDCGDDPLVSCYLGACTRTLWANQRCGPDSNLTVCLYGLQQCVDGVCQGLGTNEPCWDGYQSGEDLDCTLGWYCLRGLCVPQLPERHTCYGEHPNECIDGHLCNLLGSRSQCALEYSLPNGVLSSDRRLCQSSHIAPQVPECAAAPPYDSSGSGCSSSADCAREDGSTGECLCKRWWDGSGAPGYCELAVPDREKPAWMQFWQLSTAYCHHNWPEDRCAAEMGKQDLYHMVLIERQATADPTLPVPGCAHSLLVVYSGFANIACRCVTPAFGVFVVTVLIEIGGLPRQH